MLQERAAEVRAYLSSGSSGRHLGSLLSFPTGCCKVASLLLLQWLNDREGVKDALGIANARRPNPYTPGKDATHFWLEVGDVIVDITADQFDDYSEPVHVSSNRAWHETFAGGRRYPQADFIPLNGIHMQEYQAMVEYLDNRDGPRQADVGSPS